MVNRIFSAFSFLLAVVIGLFLGAAGLLGILYSIPKVIEKLDYYD
jgi:hypothetical protein